jgi:proteasome lid subunit RPN8/RPN11
MNLRFSPTAWAKLLFLRDYGRTEIGGFGISSLDDLLRIEDVQLVRQNCSAIAVEFDDTDVARFFDEQVDAGRTPAEFGRIWIHTHPGDSAQPSLTDEETFSRVFGATDWAVMLILARGGECYCRLRFNAGPTGEILLPVDVDYQPAFGGSDPAAWEQDYLQHVTPRPVLPPFVRAGAGGAKEFDDFPWPGASDDDEFFTSPYIY